MSGTTRPTVTVASRLPLAVRISSTTLTRSNEPEITAIIVGERDPGAVVGAGLSYDVDQETFEAWLAANPDMAEFVKVTTPEEIEHYSDPLNTNGYEIGLGNAAPEPPPQAPPVNRDVPYAEQRGATLNCTMGNWDNVPDSYAYDWHKDGVSTGIVSSDYPVQAGDAGHSFTCVVTATNALGSTTAPPSNAVVVV
jgi:hypothetical protein